MNKFLESLHDWNTPVFKQTLKADIQKHKAKLPLHEGVKQGGMVDASDIETTIFWYVFF